LLGETRWRRCFERAHLIAIWHDDPHCPAITIAKELVDMRPKIIVVMRHAEKPEDPGNPHLSTEGYARAQRLAEFVPDRFGAPDYIFAAAVTEHSARSSETVAPLAQSLGKEVLTPYQAARFAPLTAEVLTEEQYTNTMVLICWHHDHLPGIALALGAESGEYPDPWDPEVFNRVLCFRFSSESGLEVSQVLEEF
jgi:phosphohistidine phosphatase SixA